MSIHLLIRVRVVQSRIQLANLHADRTLRINLLLEQLLDVLTPLSQIADKNRSKRWNGEFWGFVFVLDLV